MAAQVSIRPDTNPAFKARRGNPKGRKGFQAQARVYGTLHSHPLPLLGVPQNTKLCIYNIYALDLAQTHRVFVTSVTVRSYEPCLVDSVGPVVVVPLITLVSAILPHPLLRVPLALPSVWIQISVSAPIICWAMPLMTVGVGPAL